jgi:hypothetical protein
MSWLRLSPLIIALALLVAGRARGEGPPPAPAHGAFDFDLLGAAQPPPDAHRLSELERRVRLRRGLLKAHQAVGFITLGLLAATAVIGQLDYADKYGGGDDNGRFRDAHTGLAISATVSFAAAGLLALVAPNPYPKPIKLDAALVHKVSMAAATAGMLAQIILGPITAAHEGQLDQRDYARAHLGIGWATFAAMSAGVLAYVF